MLISGQLINGGTDWDSGFQILFSLSCAGNFHSQSTRKPVTSRSIPFKNISCDSIRNVCFFMI